MAVGKTEGKELRQEMRYFDSGQLWDHLTVFSVMVTIRDQIYPEGQAMTTWCSQSNMGSRDEMRHRKKGHPHLRERLGMLVGVMGIQARSQSSWKPQEH